MSEQLLVIPKCETTSTSLIISQSTTQAEWEAIGRLLGKVESAIQLWIGDWLRFGMCKGYVGRERYTEAEELTGLERATLRNLAWVAGKIAPELRTEDLGIERYKLIAPLPEKEQEKWIKKAAEDALTVDELRKAIRGEYPLPYPEREPFGSFYVIATVPDLHSHRIKLGFTEDTDRRLRELLTVSSTAKLIHSWPCRRSWELSIITLLTAQDCVQLGREVFQCGDVGALVTRGNQLFSILP